MRNAYLSTGAPRAHQGAPLSFFVVTGRNRCFPPTEIGRFYAVSPYGAIQRARALRADLVSGLELEARRV